MQKLPHMLAALAARVEKSPPRTEESEHAMSFSEVLAFALFLEAHGLCLSDLHHTITNPTKG